MAITKVRLPEAAAQASSPRRWPLAGLRSGSLLPWPGFCRRARAAMAKRFWPVLSVALILAALVALGLTSVPWLALVAASASVIFPAAAAKHLY